LTVTRAAKEYILANIAMLQFQELRDRNIELLIGRMPQPFVEDDLGPAVQKAYMRVDALDDLTVELQYQTQYAVRRRMLGPEIEGPHREGEHRIPANDNSTLWQPPHDPARRRTPSLSADRSARSKG
jgi:hypothetical protein